MSPPRIPPSALSAWPRLLLQHHGLQETTRDNSTASRSAYPKKENPKEDFSKLPFSKLTLKIVAPTDRLDALQERKPRIALSENPLGHFNRADPRLDSQ